MTPALRRAVDNEWPPDHCRRSARPDGGVVTQRTANPCTPVRFRLGPPPAAGLLRGDSDSRSDRRELSISGRPPSATGQAGGRLAHNARAPAPCRDVPIDTKVARPVPTQLGPSPIRRPPDAPDQILPKRGVITFGVTFAVTNPTGPGGRHLQRPCRYPTKE